MDTKLTIVRAAKREFGLAATGLIGALSIFVTTSAAQESEDLSNVIFEPVALSAALEPPALLERSSTSDSQALLKSVGQHLAAIETLKRPGASNFELIAELGALAVAYQGLDRHEDAIDALDEGIDLTKEDGGRDNIEQVPLLEQKAVSYLALNDIRRTDDTEELVYSLKERRYSPESREMYYATINLADWNTTAYYRENYGAGNRTLRRQRGVIRRVQRCIRTPSSAGAIDASTCGENPIFTGAIKDVFDQDINDARLRKVDRLYVRFQEALLDGGNVQLDMVIDIAKRIARLAFATKQEMDYERENYTYDPNYEGSRERELRNSAARMDESYLTGEKALQYAISAPRSVAGLRPEAMAAALLDLGDWQLVYGKAVGAEGAYKEAFQVLLDAGFSSENIDIALATDLPIAIPVFATHVYTRRSNGLRADAELNIRGYVDVSYTVDSLGNPNDVEFFGRSSKDATEVERLLNVQFGLMKFRPVLSGGNLTDSGPVQARYFYSY
jgi:tetratricopeptide (TPR) repeat protein